MRIRLTLIAAVLTLVAIAFLMSCSSKYSSSSNGLVIVPTQGTIESPQSTAVMETFSLDLTNGGMSQINNVNGPPTQGLPSSVIINHHDSGISQPNRHHCVSDRLRRQVGDGNTYDA